MIRTIMIQECFFLKQLFTYQVGVCWLYYYGINNNREEVMCLDVFTPGANFILVAPQGASHRQRTCVHNLATCVSNSGSQHGTVCFKWGSQRIITQQEKITCCRYLRVWPAWTSRRMGLHTRSFLVSSVSTLLLSDTPLQLWSCLLIMRGLWKIN